MVNMAEAELFDGTDTDGADHEAIRPGIFGRFNAAGTTVPSKPLRLVNVTL